MLTIVARLHRLPLALLLEHVPLNQGRLQPPTPYSQVRLMIRPGLLKMFQGMNTPYLGMLSGLPRPSDSVLLHLEICQ